MSTIYSIVVVLSTTIRQICKIMGKVAPIVLCIVKTQISKTSVQGLAGTLGHVNSYVISSSFNAESRTLGITLYIVDLCNWI